MKIKLARVFRASDKVCNPTVEPCENPNAKLLAYPSFKDLNLFARQEIEAIYDTAMRFTWKALVRVVDRLTGTIESQAAMKTTPELGREKCPFCNVKKTNGEGILTSVFLTHRKDVSIDRYLQ
jgi:hypothetical protein